MWPPSHIFDVCRISVTRFSVPERCFISYQRKYLYLLQLSNFLELRHVSLRCAKRQKFQLVIVATIAANTLQLPKLGANAMFVERKVHYSALFTNLEW